MIKVRKWFNLISMLRNQAAAKIQAAWGRYRHIKIVPYLMTEHRDYAACMIQKHLRGYMVNKHYAGQISNIRMESCFAYFDKMKLMIQTTAQILIAFHMRKSLKKMHAAKKPTKGKKGKKGSTKKGATTSARRTS